MGDGGIYDSIAASPLVYCQYFAPGVFNIDFGPVHYDLERVVFGESGTEFAVMMTRGIGKSMVCSVGFPLYSITVGGLRNVVIVSGSRDLAQQFISQIKQIVKGDRHTAIFGDLEGEVWSKYEVILKGTGRFSHIHGSIKAYGMDQQLVGMNAAVNGQAIRPQLIIADDIEDSKSVYTGEMTKKRMNIVDTELLPAVHDHKSKFVMIGTTFSYESVIQWYSSRANVKTVRYPIFVQDQAQATRLSMGGKFPLEVGDSVWEANPKFAKAVMMQKRQEALDNGPTAYQAFLSQYMLDPRVAGRSFNLENIPEFDVDGLPDTKEPLKTFGLIDMAYSRNNKADNAGILVVGTYDFRQILVFEAIEGRWGDDEVMSRAAELFAPYRSSLLMCGIESYAWKTFSNQLGERLAKNGIIAPIIELKTKNRPKEDRIRGLIPYTENKIICMRRGLEELRHQFAKFNAQPGQKGLNLLDPLAYAPEIFLIHDFSDPAERDPVALKKKEEDEAWETLVAQVAEYQGGGEHSPEYLEDLF